MGCSKDTTITIADVTPTVFVGDIQHVTCNGSANELLMLLFLRELLTISSRWDNGMMTEDISGLTAGTYRLKITDETDVAFESF